MNRSILILLAAAVALSACGIKRPLMRPSEIPAYEEKRARKLEKLNAPADGESTLPARTPAQQTLAPDLPMQEPDTIQTGRTPLQQMLSPFPPVEQQ